MRIFTAGSAGDFSLKQRGQMEGKIAPDLELSLNRKLQTAL